MSHTVTSRPEFKEVSRKSPKFVFDQLTQRFTEVVKTKKARLSGINCCVLQYIYDFRYLQCNRQKQPPEKKIKIPVVTDTKRQSVAMEKKKQAFAEVNKNMQSSAKEKLARKLTEKRAPAEEKKSPTAEKQQSSPTAIQYELHTKNSGYQLPMPLFALNVSSKPLAI